MEAFPAAPILLRMLESAPMLSRFWMGVMARLAEGLAERGFFSLVEPRRRKTLLSVGLEVELLESFLVAEVVSRLLSFNGGITVGSTFSVSNI